MVLFDDSFLGLIPCMYNLDSLPDKQVARWSPHGLYSIPQPVPPPQDIFSGWPWVDFL